MSTLRNVTTGAIIATNMRNAESFWERTVGFLGREHISADEGLWITQCAGVHTMGMRSNIDIIFVDRAGFVLRIVRNVKPNVPKVNCALAAAVIETGPAALLGHDLLVGDQLVLQSTSTAA